jgi:hypothetical protein
MHKCKIHLDNVMYFNKLVFQGLVITVSVGLFTYFRF